MDPSHLSSSMYGAVKRVPVEIWDLILNLVIEVQGLNTLQIGIPPCVGGGASYRESEHQRRSLRLVCRNWDQLMTKRKHRLLHFLRHSVWETSSEPISRAKHLIVDHSKILSPYLEQHDFKYRLAPPAWLRSPISIFVKEARQAGCLRVESLHLKLPKCNMTESHFLQLRPILPKLTVLVIDFKLSPCTALSISEIFPNLISLSLIISGSLSPATAIQPQPEFRKLEFLSIYGGKNGILMLHFETWKLPSLRILQFYRITLNVERVEPLDQIFPQDCRGVEVLSLGLINNHLFIDHEFWEFFPNIQTFYPHLYHTWITEPPAVSHPFSSLIFNPTETDGDAAKQSLHAFIDFIGLCEGIQQVRLSITWDTFCCRTSNEDSRYPWWRRIFEECQDISKELSLEDGDGIPYKPEHGDMFTANEAILMKQRRLPRKQRDKQRDKQRCRGVSCSKLLATVVGSEGIVLGL